MPKLKTNSSVKKRFFITAGGKVGKKQPSKRHLLTCKNASRKMSLRKKVFLNKVTADHIKKLMPYGSKH